MSVRREGGTFRFDLRLTNTARAPLQQGYGACEPVVVSREDTGEVVWQSGNGPCPTVLLDLDLGPGETFTLGARWNGRDSLGTPAAPGRYRVRMALRGFGATASFRVP